MRSSSRPCRIWSGASTSMHELTFTEAELAAWGAGDAAPAEAAFLALGFDDDRAGVAAAAGTQTVTAPGLAGLLTVRTAAADRRIEIGADPALVGIPESANDD